jgi:hypothetical protein
MKLLLFPERSIVSAFTMQIGNMTAFYPPIYQAATFRPVTAYIPIALHCDCPCRKMACVRRTAFLTLVVVSLGDSLPVEVSWATTNVICAKNTSGIGLRNAGLEPRLQLRYRQLVVEQLHVSEPLAVGIHALAVSGLANGCAVILGAHSVLKNESVTLPHLIEPLHQVAQQWRRQTPDAWGLVVHEWSTLKYAEHARKTDQTWLGHRKDRWRSWRQMRSKP